MMSWPKCHLICGLGSQCWTVLGTGLKPFEGACLDGPFFFALALVAGQQGERGHEGSPRACLRPSFEELVGLVKLAFVAGLC